ncbi:MAG: NAD(P)-dependent glycerol-3-phosphate dehydrogenase [Chloroflexi bacterium]|nr:NAD(P)-dependent glycerol-3-phosphate dehydrogenase [Chloroflexota bacterium]
MATIGVINAGGWGTALAVLLAHHRHAVRLWCRRQELADEIDSTRRNSAYLPEVAIPGAVHATVRIDEAVDGAELVLLVPISRAVRETTRLVAPHLRRGTLVLHGAKGLEQPSLLRLSEVIAEELGPLYRRRVAVLSGPTHAEEVARLLPTATVVACHEPDTATAIQELLHGPTFRVYTSPDVVGVELCAALKNVVALAIGAADGLGYGDNARAALITRALVEIGRLVQAAGGDGRTVGGLAGLGDVIATCTSRHSRNRRAGELLGQGWPVEQILAGTRQVIEGVPATAAALRLAARHGVELPVCAQVDRVLHHGASAREALAQLMGREATAELPPDSLAVRRSCG